MTAEQQPTPSLAEYLRMEAEDDNTFWRLQSGDHQNLLEEAIEEIDRLSGSIQECGSDIHDGVFDDPEESS